MMPITNMSMAPQEKTMLAFWILLSGRWIIVDKNFYRRLPPMFHMSFLWWVRRWKTESECSLTAEVLSEILVEAEAEVTWRAEKNNFLFLPFIHKGQTVVRATNCHGILCLLVWPLTLGHKALVQQSYATVLWESYNVARSYTIEKDIRNRLLKTFDRHNWRSSLLQWERCVLGWVDTGWSLWRGESSGLLDKCSVNWHHKRECPSEILDVL